MKKKRLTGPYKRAYLNIKWDLCQKSRRSKERDALLTDIAEMLRRAQKDGVPLERVFDSGLDAFCTEILAAVPAYTLTERRRRHLFRRWRNGLAAAVALGVILCLISHSTGFTSYLQRGMSSLLNTYHRQIQDPDQAVFQLRLDALDAHAGQTIFEKNGCSVVIDRLYTRPDGKSRHEVYMDLYCYGAYDFFHARFYSPRTGADSGENADPSAVGWVEFGESRSPAILVGIGPSGRDFYSYGVYLGSFPKEADLSDMALRCTLDGFILHTYERR